MSTVPIDTARRSEVLAPAQQHAQVEVMNTMMSYGTGLRAVSSDHEELRPGMSCSLRYLAWLNQRYGIRLLRYRSLPRCL
jgi:hypothetical protein